MAPELLEFEVGGHAYRAARLDAFQQIHVARRLAPVLGSVAAGLAPIVRELIGALGQAGDNRSGVVIGLLASRAEQILACLPTLGDALGRINDEDAEYILKTCLGVVQRKVEGGWNRVTAQNNGSIMPDFDDINGVVALLIARKVVEANLGNFMPALPSKSSSGAPAV